MSDNKVLNEIYYENREINRNLQTICSMGFALFFMNVLKDAKARGNETVQMVSKVGLVLVAILQFLIAGMQVADFIKRNDGK